jgi:DNA-binding CsgD family transcriptional regulator
MRAREDGTRGELPIKPTPREPTPRELEYLKLASQGYIDRETAVRMHVSTQTVKNQLMAVRRKLGARTTSHAVAIGKDMGMI